MKVFSIICNSEVSQDFFFHFHRKLFNYYQSEKTSRSLITPFLYFLFYLSRIRTQLGFSLFTNACYRVPSSRALEHTRVYFLRFHIKVFYWKAEASEFWTTTMYAASAACYASHETSRHHVLCCFAVSVIHRSDVVSRTYSRVRVLQKLLKYL